jgi:hypothetical protein
MVVKFPPPDVEELSAVQWAESDDGELFDPMVHAAKGFLLQFRWCREVVDLKVGIAAPGVVAVFLAQIATDSADVDDFVWVVVGDLPPAYIVLDRAPDSRRALSCYADEMDRWVHAVEAGQAVQGLIPVDGAATVRNAEALKVRLAFLRSEILNDRP